MALRPSKKILPHLENRAPRYDDHRPVDPREKLRGRFRRMLAIAAFLVAMLALYPILNRQDQSRPRRNGLAQVTACDRLAAHPLDTQRTAPSVEDADLDAEGARRACARALRQDPDDGRTLYEAARAAFASKDEQTAMELLRRSAAAGYAQGQFTLSARLLHGEGVNADICEAGRLVMQAAKQRHLYARLRLAENWADGVFRTCQLEIPESEIVAMLLAADDLAATTDDIAALDVARRKWDAAASRQ